MLWNMGGPKPQLVQTLLGHRHRDQPGVRPRRRLPLSGAADGTVILRDMRSRDPVARSLSHSGTEQAAKRNPSTTWRESR